MKKCFLLILCLSLFPTFIQAQPVLTYEVYVPSTLLQRLTNNLRVTKKLPLVVALHGCSQDAKTFSQITKLNELAEKENFIVLYPEQSIILNINKCWNWFLPFNQKRGMGEPAAIINTVNAIKKKYPIDNSKVFVLGLSAGAAMSNIMANCYRDVFSAVAMHSGLQFAAAANLLEANLIAKNQSRVSPATSALKAFNCLQESAKELPAFIVVGVDDKIINPKHSQQVISQYMSMADYLDDGVLNKSRVIRLMNSTKLQVPQGHTYVLQQMGDFLNRSIIQYLEVQGMEHAWSGGSKGFDYSDPKGPNASDLMWKFFNQKK